ncbi:uncharacterized protein BT62DRAFT_612556 [Guyanagaster necrorhizus]|uniref:Uncharacterized protein n=1 Tax=Guyanagaster necrorhizus TaxID=856835 RepID=A0A9P8AVS6_9AGAR|nr:uncharacterized protein BT62DRAFT_612556 [Guyanagaster necrorhizus MCA 3950]KAG7449884.1 hypothetical protein BT62DRAFT_612556 [Guyanagaster necrorhizus MCA 3950]
MKNGYAAVSIYLLDCLLWSFCDYMHLFTIQCKSLGANAAVRSQSYVAMRGRLPVRIMFLTLRPSLSTMVRLHQGQGQNNRRKPSQRASETGVLPISSVSRPLKVGNNWKGLKHVLVCVRTIRYLGAEGSNLTDRHHLRHVRLLSRSTFQNLQNGLRSTEIVPICRRLA